MLTATSNLVAGLVYGSSRLFLRIELRIERRAAFRFLLSNRLLLPAVGGTAEVGWDGMVWGWYGMAWAGMGLDGLRKDELTCEYCLLESFKRLKYSYRIMAWLRLTYRTSLRNA